MMWRKKHRCSTNADCKNGGTCTQGKCTCLKGFSGDKCESVSFATGEWSNCNKNLVLSCPSGSKIQVDSAIYGPMQGVTQTATCKNVDITKNLQGLINAGNPSMYQFDAGCSFTPKYSTSDPCVGSAKVLNGTYHCVASKAK